MPAPRMEITAPLHKDRLSFDWDRIQVGNGPIRANLKNTPRKLPDDRSESAGQQVSVPVSSGAASQESSMQLGS